MDTQHGHVAWRSSIDMQHGRVAWRSSINMRHRHAAWTSNMDMRQGYIQWNTDGHVIGTGIHCTDLQLRQQHGEASNVCRMDMQL